MGNFTWEFDFPTGVAKNHDLSEKLRFAAVAEAEFAVFARPEPGFGRKKGESVTIMRSRNIAEPGDGKLNEQLKIPVDSYQMSTVQITVNEYGRAVEYTSFAEDLSKFDIMNPIQRALKDQMKLTLDTAAAAAFKTAKIKAIPTSLTGITFDTDGTPSTQATANLSFAHCGVIRDYMKDTIHVPWYSKGHYIGLGSTKALRGIKSDPEFQDLTKYLRLGDLVYESEVGKIEQIRWIEVNHTTALSNTKGLNSVLGEFVVFGDDGVAMAEVETPELRMALPGDFGRDKAVAWYGILEYGLIWDTANDGEARVIHGTSS